MFNPFTWEVPESVDVHFGSTDQTAPVIVYGPFVVRLGDISRELAMRAHSGTSMVPDKRAFQVQQEYVTEMHNRLVELNPAAFSEDQRIALGNALIEYQRGYIAKERALLAAKSRCISSMITGPSNFPVRRAQKASDSADKRLAEFMDWRKKARSRLVGAVLAARTPEEAANDEWEALKKEIDHDLITVFAIDAGQLRGYTRSAFTNSVAGKLRRRAEHGEAALVIRALDYIAEQQAKRRKPFFAPNNSVWQLKTFVVETKATPTGERTVAEYEGARVINDFDDERVRIYFDAIPQASMRSLLKASGWRWSPSNSAWQRQNTLNAEVSAITILDNNFTRRQSAPKEGSDGNTTTN